jgi:hypothetical protein
VEWLWSKLIFQMILCPDVFNDTHAGLHWNFSIDARKRGALHETVGNFFPVNSLYTGLSFLAVFTVLFMEGKEDGEGSEAILIHLFQMMHDLKALSLPHPDGTSRVTNHVHLTCDMVATNLFGNTKGPTASSPLGYNTAARDEWTNPLMYCPVGVSLGQQYLAEVLRRWKADTMTAKELEDWSLQYNGLKGASC